MNTIRTDDFTIPQLDIAPNMIHLGLGQPSNFLLPVKEIQKACAKALSNNNPFYLAYGEEQGNANFRETLASFLTEQYKYPVDDNQLLITNGNSQSLELICTLFTRPGDTIFVEEPSYFLALKIFKDHDLNIVGIPMDKNGLDVGMLEEKLKKETPKFLYTVPTFHNPASVTLSLKRRKKLAEICHKNRVLIVADEVYHFLSYQGSLPPSMGKWIDQCDLISLGSFSKILAPGLRLGWMHSNSKLIKTIIKYGVLHSGGGFNPFTSEIINTMILSGQLDKHLKMLKTTYSHRVETFCIELKKYLPQNIKFHTPSGGYFIWMELPDHIDANAFRKKAKKHDVDFLPGVLFSSKGELKNYIRLSFAFYDEDLLKEGAKRLGSLLSKA